MSGAGSMLVRSGSICPVVGFRRVDMWIYGSRAPAVTVVTDCHRRPAIRRIADGASASRHGER